MKALLSPVVVRVARARLECIHSERHEDEYKDAATDHRCLPGRPSRIVARRGIVRIHLCRLAGLPWPANAARRPINVRLSSMELEGSRLRLSESRGGNVGASA